MYEIQILSIHINRIQYQSICWWIQVWLCSYWQWESDDCKCFKYYSHLISESKATVTYKNETVTLISKDGYEYKGFGESGVVIVSNRVNGVLSRITIGGTFRGQTVILVYKRINSK